MKNLNHYVIKTLENVFHPEKELFLLSTAQITVQKLAGKTD